MTQAANRPPRRSRRGPARTSGQPRREYDERALDRLRFIARAEELDCLLEEVASLLTAFDEDCADNARDPARNGARPSRADGDRP